MSENERYAKMAEDQAGGCEEAAAGWRAFGDEYGNARAAEIAAEAADWRTIAAILRSAPAGQRIEATVAAFGLEHSKGVIPLGTRVTVILHAAPEAGGGGG